MYEDLLRDLRDAEAYGGEDAYMIGQAADAIEVLSKMETTTPRWISVKERLPRVKEDGFSEDVYVTDGTDIEKTQLMMAYDGMTGWGYTGIGKITHWCERIPLPEPPKEET